MERKIGYKEIILFIVAGILVVLSASVALKYDNSPSLGNIGINFKNISIETQNSSIINIPIHPIIETNEKLNATTALLKVLEYDYESILEAIVNGSLIAIISEEETYNIGFIINIKYLNKPEEVIGVYKVSGGYVEKLGISVTLLNASYQEATKEEIKLYFRNWPRDEYDNIIFITCTWNNTLYSIYGFAWNNDVKLTYRDIYVYEGEYRYVKLSDDEYSALEGKIYIIILRNASST